MVTPEITQILLSAADRVEFKGWCQGERAKCRGWSVHPENPEADSWSMYGAILRELPTDKDWGRTFVYHVMGLLRKATGWTGSMDDYNDAPKRTAAEVSRLLRATALEGLWSC